MTNKEQRWINLINNGEFKLTRADSAYFRYLNHSTEEIRISDISSLFIYFIKNTPFDLDVYIDFIKKIDAIYLRAFGQSNVMDIFYEEVIFPNYFYEKDYRTILKPNLNLSVTDKEKLKVFLYCIRCAVHYKFDYLIKKYLDYLKQIDQNLYQELVSSSHEKLEIEVIETSNEYFQATSNTILATIKIIAFENKQENYKAILDYVNQLFEQGFPKNHTLEFEVKGMADQKELGITHLLDCGGNRFFNSAAKFHDLHEDILRYIKIIGYEARYTDIGENGRFAFKVVSFATYGLLLEDLKYMSLFMTFLDRINIYETYEQYNIPTILLTRHGVTNESVSAYLRACEALLESEHFSYRYQDLLIHFTAEASKKILEEETAKYDQENHTVNSDMILNYCVIPSSINRPI